MGRIYKILLFTIVASSTIFYSCETLELENLASPNGLSPNQADPDFLLNRIQLDYLSAITFFNNSSGNLSRIGQFRGRNYLSALGSGTLNGPWQNLYSGMIPDIAVMEELHSADNGLSFHLGVSKVMEAHILMLFIDYLGDIVYSQANNPSEYPAPAVDDDQAVYNAAIVLLDEANAYLLQGASSVSSTDFFYGGNTNKWIKLVNTLKMRANLTVGNYSAVVSATDVIIDTADDMEFSFGTNAFSPDTRHPDYNFDYRSTGAGIYQSNWLMNLMVGENGDEGSDSDPRRRYYFYRQAWRNPGSYSLIVDLLGLIGEPDDVFAFDGVGCEFLPPAHYEFTPDEDYSCGVKLGYWGRSHGNNGGIPPDNFDRTAVGVYPSGGSFDAVADAFPWVGETIDINQQVGLGNGGGGAGIEPIFLASYVDFMKAEAELKLGNTPAAAIYLEAGLTKSIAKVMSFGDLDFGADMSQAPDEATVNAFIALKVNEFNNADLITGLDGLGWPLEKDKMDILGELYFVTLYGGAADAFNFIRRTGYPRTLQRNIDPIPGPFPRTLLYPSIETVSNPNLQQRTDLNTKVFWDNGILNPAN